MECFWLVACWAMNIQGCPKVHRESKKHVCSAVALTCGVHENVSISAFNRRENSSSSNTSMETWFYRIWANLDLLVYGPLFNFLDFLATFIWNDFKSHEEKPAWTVESDMSHFHPNGAVWESGSITFWLIAPLIPVAIDWYPDIPMFHCLQAILRPM